MCVCVCVLMILLPVSARRLILHPAALPVPLLVLIPVRVPVPLLVLLPVRVPVPLLVLLPVELPVPLQIPVPETKRLASTASLFDSLHHGVGFVELVLDPVSTSLKLGFTSELKSVSLVISRVLFESLELTSSQGDPDVRRKDLQLDYWHLQSHYLSSPLKIAVQLIETSALAPLLAHYTTIHFQLL